jgi:hypothetical protein
MSDVDASLINTNIKYSNVSLDGKVAFIEEGHKYVMLSDPTIKWTSVTQLLSNYKEKFDAEATAKKVCSNKSNILYYGRDWREVVQEWNSVGKAASEDGTMLHKYGEDLFNKVDKSCLTIPDHQKSKYVEEVVEKLFGDGYELAKTEILLYDRDIKVAGQSDILLKKKVINPDAHFSDTPSYNYMIFDWKFTKKPLEKKSYYNRKTGYKMMSGPFKYLHDCNWIHYSIQLAIYQTLLGLPEKVKEKVLIVVTPEGAEFVPAYPMRVYWTRSGELHAAYETHGGKWYVSEDDKLYSTKPTWIRAL